MARAVLFELGVMYATDHRLTVHREDNSALYRDLFRIVLSVIFPPLGVFLKVRFTAHLAISVLLTLMGYVPGLVHAIWVLAKRPDELWPRSRG